jgi:hypothetical protein
MSSPECVISAHCEADRCMKWEPSAMPYYGADTTICNTPTTYSKTHWHCAG